MDLLDAAELAYTASALDVFGGYDASGERLPPVCSADVEERTVTVDVARHRVPQCCERVDLAHTCLSAGTAALGHQWFDRAWLALDAATRAAQHASSLESLEHACCATLYYAALADWCGRTEVNDYWRLAGASVTRSDDGLGAECAAFDDGHRDRDLNDWVVEQRLVEVMRADGTLASVNVHVLPLARGGGYRASYALSLRGTTLEAVDRGANAACSERARAVLAETYDAGAVGDALAHRVEFAEGTFVGVLRHSTRDDEPLPLGVRDTECAQLGEGPDVGYCPRQPSGTVALFRDVRAALPTLHGDALDALLNSGVRVDQSTNTQPGTRTTRALFAASAVVVPPPGAANAAGRESVRFVLQNEDCGAAVLLPTRTQRSPLAVVVPPHSCPAFRWAAEGVALVQDARAADRICRGGRDGGIAECDADGVCRDDAVCADPPALAGVPYANAYEHFQCDRCSTDAECASPDCANERCCDERLLHWYRYPNPALVYTPLQLDTTLIEQLLARKE
jgi:hypothetical protein